MTRKIAFQGEAGAFSHAAANAVFPGDAPLACTTFEETIGAVQSGAAEFANDLAERIIGKPRHRRLQHRRVDQQVAYEERRGNRSSSGHGPIVAAEGWR